MIKLIASDLDGTLLQGTAKQLNPEVFDLILKLKEHGVLFVAASGRQLASMQRLFEPIQNEISYIAENGALTVHENELSVNTALERDLALRILQCTMGHPDWKVFVSGVDTCYVLEGEDEFINYLHNDYHNHTTTIQKFEDIQEAFLKISLLAKADFDSSLQYFRALFSQETKVVNSGKCWIDIVPLTSNKGTALQMLLEKLGIAAKDCVAFGDQQNDIEMLELVGKSYAVAGAPAEVKKYADAVTDSVEETLCELLK